MDLFTQVLVPITNMLDWIENFIINGLLGQGFSLLRSFGDFFTWIIPLLGGLGGTLGGFLM